MAMDPKSKSWFLRLLGAVFLLGIGAFSGGMGPCGPDTLIGQICMLLLPFAVISALICGLKLAMGPHHRPEKSE